MVDGDIQVIFGGEVAESNARGLITSETIYLE
jgi:hypothetical protein